MALARNLSGANVLSPLTFLMGDFAPPKYAYGAPASGQ